MPTALIYCRVSSAGQQDNYSLETQETACRQFAEARTLAVQDVIAEVWTGSEFWERPKLKRLRDAVRESRIDAVICYAIDRLSRDIAHLAIFAEECERANVALHFVTESFDDSAEGKLIRSVRGYTAEVERQKIKERVTRGQKARVASGKLPNGSGKLYGYTQDRETTARSINPAEAEIVRRIWRESFDLGIGANTIAKRLNAEAVPAPTIGKRNWKNGRVPRWSKGAILQILKNPAYAGLSYAFRWKCERVKGRRITTERPRSEWVLLSDSLTPTIIDPDTFAAMPERLTARRAHADGARTLTNPVLLRGFIFCARCGRRRIFDPGHGAYRCASRNGIDGACGSKPTPQKAIEDCVRSEVEKLITDPEKMASILERATSAAVDDKAALRRRAKQIEKQIAKNRESQEKLLARFADVGDSLSELIEKQVRALDAETKRLTAELQESTARLSLSAKQKLQAAALVKLASHSREGGTIEAERQRFDALGLRVFTDGRIDWRIEFAVALPEIETGHSALNLTLFEAERPDCPDGRSLRFARG